MTEITPDEIARRAIDTLLSHIDLGVVHAKQAALDEIASAYRGVVVDEFDDAEVREFDFDKNRDVLAYDAWPDNSFLIADVAKLGYLRKEWTTWDATYGKGVFWKRFRPDTLVGTDINPNKSDKIVGPVDFTKSPWEDRMFDCVVFDPDYRLNGTPDQDKDEGYGTNENLTWQQRMEKMRLGVYECARVLGDGYLLVKCMSQVSSGKVRWQVDEVTRWAAECGLGKKDQFDFIGDYRKQPDGREQKHARRFVSTLLVFKRGWNTSHEKGDRSPVKVPLTQT